MFRLIKKDIRLGIVDVVRAFWLIEVLDDSRSNKVKFSYINDKIISKNANSKIKKRRYRNGNR